MRMSRRKFLVAAGCAGTVAALPRGIVSVGVPPAALPIEAAIDFPPAHFPKVGDLLFMNRDGVYTMDGFGKVTKLSKDIRIEHGIQYNAIVGSSGIYAGIERSANVRLDRMLKTHDAYLRKPSRNKRRRS